MSFRSRLAVVMGLSSILASAVACHSKQRPDALGAVDVVVRSFDGEGAPAAGTFLLSGLDASRTARVAVPRDAHGRVRAQLPAGVYAVEWLPHIESDGDMVAALPVEPQVLVVAPGRVTTLVADAVPGIAPEQLLAQNDY